MSKRSGYIVSVQFFVDADPNVPATMTKAFEVMAKVEAAVSGLAPMKMSHQFVRRHEVPDAPVAVTQTTADMPRTIVEPFREAVAMERMPDIPTDLDATKRRS